MKRYLDFGQYLKSVPWPKFRGLGVHTALRNTSFPRNSGKFFLGACLSLKVFNGKAVFTNEVF